ncbi:thermonuclease family protein [Constantimarinum furrinae]|uniref:TNase-like domain-containing protein n=1 Tax=Constantimarinum furrinae TaxID=2562285 RepID=A0A7G8PUC5_9FLAO|nr:thermonuclease family protein [Constantimarinum furrinae]QNJ97941.1 hypothetical protein ALE3EI_1379 [Constantimarinum furrinae]
MYNYKAKINEVCDGETVMAIVDLGFSNYKELKLRLYGVNAPKIPDEEREAGIMTRDLLKEKILNKEVEIHTYKNRINGAESYLVTILLGDTNINRWLIDNGHAEPLKN